VPKKRQRTAALQNLAGCCFCFENTVLAGQQTRSEFRQVLQWGSPLPLFENAFAPPLAMARDCFEFQTVVVGAGPAGLAAACAAAESGLRVGVLDDTPWLGGQIWRGHQARRIVPEARLWMERFEKSGAILLDRTTVIAAPRPGVLQAEHEGAPRQIAYDRLIVATGARELFLPFPGWTLPGVVGPGGILSMAKSGWPVAGKRVVIAGSGPLLFAAADGLRKLGAQIVCIAEQAPQSSVTRFVFGLASHPAKLRQAIALRFRQRGIAYHCGVWPIAAEGEDSVRAVRLTDGRKTWTETCDLFACGFGLEPNVELALALGCSLRNGFVAVDDFQATTAPNVYCAGEPTGIAGADCAMVEGQIAGYAAANNQAAAQACFGERASWHRFRASLSKAFKLRAELKALAQDETLLCRCEDVSFGQARRFSSWREAKLQSRCGMGACQGRICGSAARFLFGWSMESVRPPILPARVGSLVPPTPAMPQAQAESNRSNRAVLTSDLAPVKT
jgi:D-hydroxyproline dehydrogenase subunit alpha